MANGNGEVQRLGDFLRSLRSFWFMIVPLGLWIVRVEVFAQQGNRYTAEMAISDKAEIRKEIHEEISKLPPKLYRDYIDEKFKGLEARLDRIEKYLEDK